MFSEEEPMSLSESPTHLKKTKTSDHFRFTGVNDVDVSYTR